MPSGDTPDLNLLFPQRAGAPEQKLFGRYTLKRVLGRGGMGVVWMAHDDELHRYVAMKFLPDMLIRDREAVNDLKRETRRSLDLTHHHIVRIYDFTQDDVCAAIIMEYVDGETLSAMKAQQSGGCFSMPTIAAWAAHFCQALDYAHRQARVVHRDLKPANLMVNSRGDLKVTDFGISRSMSDSMTRVSMSNTAGTLAYMSPEQALGAPPAGGDDVYAFGATMYDLLTGRPPFFRGNIQVQLETVIPPRMAERRDELGNQGEPIPDVWEEVVAACLAKRPQDRPQTMGEIAVMLGVGAASNSLRTTFSSGTANGVAAGVPGTTATHARTSPTDDAATRTDEIPRAPQTTRPATAGTKGAAFVSTPKPTALRDVIPGYIDEPAAKPAAPAPTPTTPTAKPPLTTPSQAKFEQPLPPPPPVSIPVVVEAELFPKEEPTPIEPPPEPAASAIPPAEFEVIDKVEPAVELPIPEPVEEAAIAEARVEPIEAPVESVEPVADEVLGEPAPISEPEAPAPVETPSSFESEVIDEQSDFPTLAGGLVFEPQLQEIESGEIVEPEAMEIPEVEDSDLEAAQTIVEEPAQVVEAEIDEAAITQVEAFVPVPAPVTAAEPELEPVSGTPATPEVAPPTPPPETSRSVAVEQPASSPSRTKSKPWLPIAAVVGVVVIAGTWFAISKRDQRPGTIAKIPSTPAALPTPVPIVTEIEKKLASARSHVTNEEFDEAIALLKAVQGIDPSNADASALLTQIDEAKRIKAEKAAMAERERKVGEYMQQAKLAKERRDWPAMRVALREARKLDFQNALMRSELETLDSEAIEGEKQAATAAEMERNRQAEEVAMREKEKEAAEAAKKRDADRAAEAAAEAERKRLAALNAERKRKKGTTQRQVRPVDKSDDRPERPPNASRRDDRPPASTQTREPARSTPPPKVTPKGPVGTGAPGG